MPFFGQMADSAKFVLGRLRGEILMGASRIRKIAGPGLWSERCTGGLLQVAPRILLDLLDFSFTASTCGPRLYLI